MAATQLSPAETAVVIAVMAVGLAVTFFFMERARLRGLRAARLRLQQRTPCSDDEFVRKLGFAPDSREAVMALGVRHAVAESLPVAPEVLTPAASPLRDPDLRPFCDSLDVVEFMMRIEERLHVAIPDRVAEKLPSPFAADDLEGMIRGLLAVVTDPSPPIPLTIQLREHEAGRWVARVPQLHDLLVQGRTREEAVAHAKHLSLHRLARQRGQALSEAALQFAVVP
jgi:acyl carrier protein